MIEQGVGCTEAVVMNREPTGLPTGSRYLFNQDGQLVDQLAEQDANDVGVGPDHRVTATEGPTGSRCYPAGVPPRMALSCEMASIGPGSTSLSSARYVLVQSPR